MNVEKLLTYIPKLKTKLILGGHFLKNAFKNPIVRWVTIISTSAVVTVMVLSILFALVLSNLAIVDFLLAVAPKTYLDGVNVLALGLDDTKDVQRSDTIMVMHLDFKHQRIGVLSIPRDTRVNIPGVGYSKINHAFARGGEELSRETVSQFLGVPIEYYIVLRLKGLESVVDELGGVMIDVKKDMYYQDQSGDLHIDLKKGSQNLDGKQAMEYLRFRHDKDADIGRIERQQGFVQAVSNQLFRSRQVFIIPNLVQKLRRNFETNLSFTQIIGLASQCRKAFRDGRIETSTVPGVPVLIDGLSYWQADMGATDKIVQKVLSGVDRQTQIDTRVETLDREASQEKRRRVTMKEMDRSLSNNLPVSPLDSLSKVLQAEVLNGIGVPGEAKRAMRILKHPQINFTHSGNAGTFKYDNTLIVVWKGNSQVNDALLIARFLSIDPSKIIVYDNSEKSVDITLVLGKDWEAIKANLKRKGTVF